MNDTIDLGEWVLLEEIITQNIEISGWQGNGQEQDGGERQRHGFLSMFGGGVGGREKIEGDNTCRQ